MLVVPGNHDHHLLEEWLERRRLEGAEPLEPRAADPGRRRARSPSSSAGPGSERIELAYPGVWLRPGVYATHGHFLDRHLTVPTFERLAVAAVERVLGRREGRATRRATGRTRGEARRPPTTTSAPRRPVYAFLFALAQAGATERAPRGLESLGPGLAGAGGRLRPSGAACGAGCSGTVAVPGAVGVANRLGLGPVRSDLSPGAVTRAGLAAIGEVVRALDIEADHLIFGHTHRRGPIRGETGWRLESGTRLWNTGSWVYAPGLLGRTAAESPYWPGTVIVLEDERQPELRHLLDDADQGRARRLIGEVRRPATRLAGRRLRR